MCRFSSPENGKRGVTEMGCGVPCGSNLWTTNQTGYLVAWLFFGFPGCPKKGGCQHKKGETLKPKALPPSLPEFMNFKLFGKTVLVVKQMCLDFFWAIYSASELQSDPSPKEIHHPKPSRPKCHETHDLKASRASPSCAMACGEKPNPSRRA